LKGSLPDIDDSGSANVQAPAIQQPVKDPFNIQTYVLLTNYIYVVAI
jgi:hypothetical protein